MIFVLLLLLFEKMDLLKQKKKKKKGEIRLLFSFFLIYVFFYTIQAAVKQIDYYFNNVEIHKEREREIGEKNYGIEMNEEEKI